MGCNVNHGCRSDCMLFLWLRGGIVLITMCGVCFVNVMTTHVVQIVLFCFGNCRLAHWEEGHSFE